MKLKIIFLIFVFFVLDINPALSFSNCQVKYDSHKRSLPALRGMCNVCHVNPAGGGATTEFGAAFEAVGFKITEELIQKFPNLFQEEKSSTSSGEVATPIIKRIKPKKVKVNVQSMISIMGKNFVDGTKAFIDNNEVLTTFKSNVLLIINFVLDSVGLHDLKLKNPNGEESNIVKVRGKS